jgi:hypothetical protein
MKFSEIKPGMIFFYGQMATALGGKAWANIMFLGEKTPTNIECYCVRAGSGEVPEVDNNPVKSILWDRNCAEYFKPMEPHIKMIVKGVFGDFE